jgi:hypothetical protein
MTVYGRRVKKNVLGMLKQVWYCFVLIKEFNEIIFQKTINWIADTDETDTDLGECDCCQLRSAGKYK